MFFFFFFKITVCLLDASFGLTKNISVLSMYVSCVFCWFFGLFRACRASFVCPFVCSCFAVLWALCIRLL